MRICFVVADIRDQQPNYAGVYLALSAHRRGHDVRFVSVDDLSFLDYRLGDVRVTRDATLDEPDIVWR